MRPTVLVLCILIGSASASPITGTMCGKFFTGASGCGGSTGVESNNFDVAVQVWPASSPTLGKLVVFFHGHGGSPTSGADFQSLAASLGYDVISLDFAYGVDYDSSVTWSPSDANCSHPDSGKCKMSLAQVCGCYTDCYGYRWRSIWQGDNHTGLPTVTSDWTIDSRLSHVISWMSTNGSTSTIRNRFAGYFDSNQHAGIKWTKITLAGHSLGASLAGYISKWITVDRVIMMSGTGDTLAPHTDMTTWGSAWGCNTNGTSGCDGTDVVGNPYTFTGCSCGHTTYGYGSANNLGFCTLTTAAVGWVNDRFEVNGGTHWATPANAYYGFEDSNDTTCNWIAPDFNTIMTARNWYTMLLGWQHLGGYPDGWNVIGGYGTGVDSFSPAKYHGVLVMNGSSATQICNGVDGNGNPVSGHNATVTSTACDNNSTDKSNRTAAWTFILTN